MVHCAERFVAPLVVVLAIAVSSAQAAPLDEAKVHYQRGDSHFKRGDYAAAIVEFEIANRLVPSPVLFYNIGLCHEQLGNTKEAIAEFRAYLREVPNARNRAAVEERVMRLEAQLLASQEPEPAPAEPPPAASAAPVQPATAPPAPPQPADSTGYSGSDPQLQRASEIDVAAVGRRYQEWGQAPASSGQAPNGAPPYSMPPPGAPPPAGVPATPDPGEPPPEETPFYKKWWFWVAAGVGALIVINIAVSDDNSNSTRTTSFSVGSATTAGAVESPLLFRF